MKNYEKTLPENYKEIYSIDAKNTKIAVIFNVLAVVIMLVLGFVMYELFFREYGLDFVKEELIPKYWSMLLLGLCLILYIVLHELTHGVAYHLLTHQKLTFGITLSVAFCGVPDIYVNKKTSLVALLSPFVVFSAIFLAGVFFLPPLWSVYSAFLFVVHFGSCVGDLYDTVLILFKFKGNLLVNDTGPKQTFYSDTEQRKSHGTKEN